MHDSHMRQEIIVSQMKRLKYLGEVTHLDCGWKDHVLPDRLILWAPRPPQSCVWNEEPSTTPHLRK